MEDKKKIENQVVALFTALSAFQGECPTIQKNKKSHFGMYADLAEILTVIRPILSKHGLAVCQFVETVEKDTFLKTIITHTGGHFLESSLRFDYVSKDIRSFGSNITYLRRYSLSSILGIVSDDDVDDKKDEYPRKEEPKKTERLSPDQIGEINDMLTDDEWPIFKKSLEVKGYKSLDDVEASKFNGLKAYIESIKPKKVEAINAY